MLDDNGEGHGSCDGLVVERGRAKAVLTDRGSDRRVKIAAGGFDDFDIFGLALFVDVEGEHNLRVLGQGLCGGGGEVDVGRGENVGGYDSCGESTGRG